MARRKIVFWEVDAQADFMLPGGKLYVPGAEKIIPNLNRLVDEARNGRVFLISHGCQHTPDDPEFAAFPPHCIRGTPGARLIPQALAHKYFTIPYEKNFQIPRNLLDYQQVVLEKQTLDIFDNPHISEVIELLGKEVEFMVFGVVTEYCVRLAAKGLLERGFRLAIVKDAIEAIDPKEGRRALEELQALGARLISTGEAVAAARGQKLQAAPR